jgi:glycosyltransferase involved in cell wall biosynthesis
MHILIVPSWYRSNKIPLSGTFFREQAQALYRGGHKVGIIFPEKFLTQTDFFHSPYTIFKELSQGIECENDCGVLTYRLTFLGWLPRVPYGNSKLFIDAGKQLFCKYIAEQGRPDVIHAHSAIYGGALAVELKKTYEIPVVITEHCSTFARGKFRPWVQKLAAATFSYADKRIVVSPKLGELLQNLYQDDFSTWDWVPNLVDPLFTNFGSHYLTESNRPFRFLNIANLTENKNHKNLLLAFTEGFKGNTTVELRIGGSGLKQSELEKMTSELDIKKQVKFLGELSREQVLEEMQQADVFVLSSDYETFGVVLIEALACGKSVIATTCGGPECIVNDKNGLLVPTRNVEKLSIAMQTMHKDIELYNPTIISQDCLVRFGGQVVVQQLTEIYHELVPNTVKIS